MSTPSHTLESTAGSQQRASAWTPLHHPVYRTLWLATVVSNIGTVMQDVSAVWLMASLTHSAVMVTLMQTSAALPLFFLALPSGALADVMDRRRLMMFAQAWMFVGTAGLACVTLFGVITPWQLLLFTFLISTGAALHIPAWMGSLGELLPHPEVPLGVSLGSLAVNVARAVGAMAGGLAVASLGPGIVFGLNACTFLMMCFLFFRWKHQPKERTLPSERIVGAVIAGIRYVRYSPPLRIVLMRTGIFILFGSGMMALLPLVARRELQLGAVGFGLLLGAFGSGAVLAATWAPTWCKRFPDERLVAAATVILAGTALTLGHVRYAPAVGAVLLLGGCAWMMMMARLSIGAGSSAPDWVKSRALATYTLVFQGGAALGGILWGLIAGRAGIPLTMTLVAGGLLLGLLAIRHYRLPALGSVNVSPSLHWPAPLTVDDPALERGPVMVTVEYLINAAQAHEFSKSMRASQLERLRDGALQWSLFVDPARPERYVEFFLIESWVQHLRQHERVTVADRDVEAKARAFHIGSLPPVVSHFVAERVDKGGNRA